MRYRVSICNEENGTSEVILEDARVGKVLAHVLDHHKLEQSSSENLPFWIGSLRHSMVYICDMEPGEWIKSRFGVVGRECFEIVRTE